MPTTTTRKKTTTRRARTNAASLSVGNRTAPPKKRAPQPAKRAAANRRKAKPKKPSTKTPSTKTTAKGRDGRLPTWADLAAENTRAPKASAAPRGFLETITTAQFALLLFVVGVLGTAYVGHTHSTDRALEAVQAERERFERLTMQRSRLKAELDAQSSLQAIMPRAQELGLEEGIEYGPVIPLD
jgi:hypothetical protein